MCVGKFVLRLMDLAWFGLARLFLIVFFAYLGGAKNYLELGVCGLFTNIYIYIYIYIYIHAPDYVHMYVTYIRT